MEIGKGEEERQEIDGEEEQKESTWQKGGQYAICK